MPRADVTLITPYPEVGVRHGGQSGVAAYSAHLAHAMAEAGARVEVVAPLPPGEPAKREADGPVTVHRAFPGNSAGARAAVSAALSCDSPVIHLQHEFFLYGGATSTPRLAHGLHALRRRRRGVVATMHQVVDPASVDRGFTDLHRVRIPAWAARRGLSTVQRSLLRSADRVLVHEPEFAAVLPGASVVPLGVEQPGPPPDREASRRALGLTPDRLVVLCFGFLAPYKGLETALEAARVAAPPVALIVAGGEHPRLVAGGDSYHELLRDRYGESARFTGRVPESDVATWFEAADVAAFMYPRPFSSSGALALAVAHGTPILASPELARTAGLPSSLTVARDPHALAARWRELAADPARLRRMRADTVALAESRRWPAVAATHLELYEEVSRERDSARRAYGYA